MLVHVDCENEHFKMSEMLAQNRADALMPPCHNDVKQETPHTSQGLHSAVKYEDVLSAHSLLRTLESRMSLTEPMMMKSTNPHEHRHGWSLSTQAHSGLCVGKCRLTLLSSLMDVWGDERQY